MMVKPDAKAQGPLPGTPDGSHQSQANHPNLPAVRQGGSWQAAVGSALATAASGAMGLAGVCIKESVWRLLPSGGRW